MKALIMWIAVIAVFTCAALTAAQVSSQTVSNELVTNAGWECMPGAGVVDGKLVITSAEGSAPLNGEFKDVRTFGEQVKHVACTNFGFFKEIEKKEPPPKCDAGGPSPAKTKAELMTYLRESFDYAQRSLISHSL